MSATARFRTALQAGDHEAAADALAADVVIHSPITSGFRFEGRAQARALFADVVTALEGIEYTEEIGEGDRRVLLAKARVGPQEVHEAVVARLNAEGEIAELTLFIRPLPGLTAVAAALGPRVARRRGRSRGMLAAAMLRPLAFATRAGEGIGAKLARPG
jgi:hypothetical protein